MANGAFSASPLSFAFATEQKGDESIFRDERRTPFASSHSLLATRGICPGLHNTLCVLAGVLLLLWFLHLLRRLIKAHKVRRQFAVQQHPLHLRGLAGYSEDLQRLLRIHFEKLVRNYNPASPLAILRVHVAVQTKSVLFLPTSSSSKSSSSSASSASSASSSFSFLPSHTGDRPCEGVFRHDISSGEERGTGEEQKGAAAAAAVGATDKGEIELVVDACDAATLVVYWGVDARALQKALAKKADEVSISLGGLDRPLHFPRSLRRIFGVRRLASSRAARGSSVHPEAARSLLELEGRESLAAAGPERESEGERLPTPDRGGNDGSSASASPPLLSPSEYRLRSAEMSSPFLSSLLRMLASLSLTQTRSWNESKATLGSFAEESTDASDADDRAEVPLIVVASLLSHPHRRMGELGHLGAVSVSEVSDERDADDDRLFNVEELKAQTESSFRRTTSTHRGTKKGHAAFSGAGLVTPTAQNSSHLGLELAKEVVLGGGLSRAQERLDVYGLEEGDTIGGEKECLVCMTNAKDVMLYPCRHCSLCFDCLRSLHQERCPICRSNFSAFVTFPFKRAHALPSSASVSASSPSTTAPPSAAALRFPGERGRNDGDRDAHGPSRAPRSFSASPERGHEQRGAERHRGVNEEDAEDRLNASASSRTGGRRERRGREPSEGLGSPESNRGVPGMLLGQLRQYVHYDELGSDVASDSDS
ncbi:conserved hypothetical protein [Neospora caninum Liverpool]|uniref:RING-type domain-containing protein n=1 Tax=Neospora caninum (strain Liverpool) TaxID=572307 RepID=F0VCV1_NEOCL|nr:conserved hypothetical protein [Neospora caninum Liverpool]CBZ51466.1 conserved hypothetical protein [Neospora caninum Liverpool]|eukprot:XP_003881499.1 conserved hypothetical protein [Neospora caninum Liverpool]